MTLKYIAKNWLIALSMFVNLTQAQGKPSNDQLVVAMTQEFDTLNPLLSAMVASTWTIGMVNRPLTLVDPKWTWVCHLCTELPSLEKGTAKIFEDKGVKKMIVEWHLKPNMKWGDGKPLTAKDFRLTWEIGRSPNVAVPSKDLFDNLEDFRLDPKDPLHFTAVWKEARYDFYQMSLIPMPSHIEGPIWEKAKDQAGSYEKLTAYTTDPTNPGLASGPYIVTEVKLGSHVIVKKNPYWFGKPANIAKIVLKLIPNTQALEAALLSGEVDMLNELGMSFDQATEFEKRLNQDAKLSSLYKVQFANGLTYEHIDLNLRNPLLADKSVRKALIYAIDRQKLSKSLFAGKQVVALSMVHPMDSFYTNDVVKYDYDAKKSAELLDAAGWKLESDNIRHKNGQPLELSVMTTAQNKTRELVEQFIQAELKKVGIRLSIKNEPARVFFGETLPKGKWNGLAMYAWISAPDSPPKSTLHSKEIPSEKNHYAGQNNCAFSNARVDEILDGIFKEFDAIKRNAMMAELQKIYTEEVPVIPLYMRSEIAVIPSTLSGFQMSGHQYYSTNWIEDWSIEEKRSH